MKKLKEYFADYKSKEKKRREQELRAEFKVVARGGMLWLTHNGVAIYEFPDNTSASCIAQRLKEAQDTSLNFTLYEY